MCSCFQGCFNEEMGDAGQSSRVLKREYCGKGDSSVFSHLHLSGYMGLFRYLLKLNY